MWFINLHSTDKTEQDHLVSIFMPIPVTTQPYLRLLSTCECVSESHLFATLLMFLSQ
jgi:hypothetical protein